MTTMHAAIAIFAWAVVALGLFYAGLIAFARYARQTSLPLWPGLVAALAAAAVLCLA